MPTGTAPCGTRTSRPESHSSRRSATWARRSSSATSARPVSSATSASASGRCPMTRKRPARSTRSASPNTVGSATSRSARARDSSVPAARAASTACSGSASRRTASSSACSRSHARRSWPRLCSSTACPAVPASCPPGIRLTDSARAQAAEGSRTAARADTARQVATDRGRPVPSASAKTACPRWRRAVRTSAGPSSGCGATGSRTGSLPATADARRPHAPTYQVGRRPSTSGAAVGSDLRRGPPHHCGPRHPRPGLAADPGERPWGGCCHC